MRLVSALAFVVAVLAGCTDIPAPDPGRSHVLPVAPIVLEETFRGTVLSANTPVILVSPDQAGDVERWFYVHDDTTRLDLSLRTNRFDLTMEVHAPDCHAQDCATVVETDDRVAEHRIDAPKPGPWEVVFFLAEEGAEEVYYELTVTKTQERMHDPEHDVYDGSVVALHLGAARISPDQLGDVYHEFWVHEGTTNMTIDVAVSDDIHFVVGQSHPSRDRGSEQGADTKDRKMSLLFQDPQPGGWYFIFFHREQGPGVADVDYRVDVTKHRDARHHA